MIELSEDLRSGFIVYGGAKGTVPESTHIKLTSVLALKQLRIIK
jgi:hypothetical protein